MGNSSTKYERLYDEIVDHLATTREFNSIPIFKMSLTNVESNRKEIIEKAKSKYKNFDNDFDAIAKYMKDEIVAYARNVLPRFGRSKTNGMLMFGNQSPCDTRTRRNNTDRKRKTRRA